MVFMARRLGGRVVTVFVRAHTLQPLETARATNVLTNVLTNAKRVYVAVLPSLFFLVRPCPSVIHVLPALDVSTWAVFLRGLYFCRHLPVVLYRSCFAVCALQSVLCSLCFAVCALQFVLYRSSRKHLSQSNIVSHGVTTQGVAFAAVATVCCLHAAHVNEDDWYTMLVQIPHMHLALPQSASRSTPFRALCSVPGSVMHPASRPRLCPAPQALFPVSRRTVTVHCVPVAPALRLRAPRPHAGGRLRAPAAVGRLRMPARPSCEFGLLKSFKESRVRGIGSAATLALVPESSG